MKKKKFFLVLIILFVILFVIWFFIKKNTNKQEFIEYTPQQEISEEQERKCLVSLYFRNKETKMLMPEARLIDAKTLIENPYYTLINLLIEGPKNEKLESALPQGTKLNNVKIEQDMVIVDLSKEFIKNTNLGAEEESKIIYSIVNTLTELTEVNSVKILIDGEEGKEFEDGEINFKQPFARMK